MKIMMNGLLKVACLALALAVPTAYSASRDNIMVVGSSTVFPFSKVVAERFGRKTKFKAPKVEPTGTGGGFKEFCKGIGLSYPDIANASRRIKKSEFDDCRDNGVKDVIEVQIGYDGIVIANSVKSKPFALSLRDVFLGLAKMVPDPKNEGKLIANPYKTWQEVNPKLPGSKIEVFGPPPTSGTRDAFVELAMEGGCSHFSWIKALKKTDKNRYKAICHGMREDGAFVEAGENDNLIVRKLNESSSALGIFGFSFLDQNADKVHAATIDGNHPTFESIAAGDYMVSRPLYFYVKKAHVGVIPGIREFLIEFTSRGSWSEEGYLAEKGLIPLPREERREIAKRVRALEPMPADALTMH